jgi:hypothetical protein
MVRHGSIDVQDIGPLGGLGEIAKLGLTLAEAKQVLARLQQVGSSSNCVMPVDGLTDRMLAAPMSDESHREMGAGPWRPGLGRRVPGWTLGHLRFGAGDSPVS